MSGIFWASYVALWLFAIVLGAGLFALYHHIGRMYLTGHEGRLNQGPAVGERLRPINGRAVNGERLARPASATSLLVFMDVNCSLCRSLRQELRVFGGSNPATDITVICGGKEDQVREWAAGLDMIPVIPDPNQAMTSRYKIGVTPFAVATHDGIVAIKGIINSGDDLEFFAATADANAAQREDEPREAHVA